MCGGLLGYCRSEFGVNRECSESELCQRERYFYSLGVVNVPRIKDSSIAHDIYNGVDRCRIIQPERSYMLRIMMNAMNKI